MVEQNSLLKLLGGELKLQVSFAKVGGVDQGGGGASRTSPPLYVHPFGVQNFWTILVESRMTN